MFFPIAYVPQKSLGQQINNSIANQEYISAKTVYNLMIVWIILSNFVAKAVLINSTVFSPKKIRNITSKQSKQRLTYAKCCSKYRLTLKMYIMEMCKRWSTSYFKRSILKSYLHFFCLIKSLPELINNNSLQKLPDFYLRLPISPELTLGVLTFRRSKL